MPRLVAALIVGWLTTFALAAEASVIRHSFFAEEHSRRIQLRDRPVPGFLSHLDDFDELDDFRGHRRFRKYRRHLAFLWHLLDRIERRHDDADSDSDGFCSFRTPQFCSTSGNVFLETPRTPQPGTVPAFPVVPEPGTAWLLVAGLGGLALWRRRAPR